MRKSTAVIASVTTVALAMAASLVHALEITSRQTAPDQLDLVFRNETPVNVAEARTLIALAARTACAGRIPSMGNFTVAQASGAAPGTPAVFQMTQKVACSGVSPETQTSASLSPEQKRAIEQDVKSVVERHFRLVNSGALDTAFQDLTPDWNKESWKFERQSLLFIMGSLEKVDIVRATVIENPPGAPRPGVYISVDFRNSYQNVPIECGNFMWFQVAEGEFRIARAGHRFLTKEHLATIPPEGIPAVERLLGCARP